MKKHPHTLDFVIAFFFLFSSVILVTFIVTEVQRQTKRDGTYSRFTTCALSIPAEERGQDRIEDCWTKVQADTGVTVKRYDK